jgi:hypothetical protein
MAIISKNILGEVRGKLGDMVLKVKNGKQIAYLRSSTFNKSNSRAAEEGRQNFKVSRQLSSELIKIPSLKQIWKAAKIGGNSEYNRIIKYNRAKCKNHNLTTQNIITPPGGVELAVDSLNLSPVEILFAININKGGLDGVLDPPSRFYTCIYAYNPIKDGERFKILTITKDINQSPENDQYNIPLSIVQQHIISKYKNTIIYLAAAKSDGDNLRWTSTYAEEIEI